MSPDLKKRIPTAILYVVIIATAFLYSPISAMILLWIFFAICLYEFVRVSAPRHLLLLTFLGHGLVSLAISSLISSTILIYLCGINVAILLYWTFCLITTKKSNINNQTIYFGALGYLILPFMTAIAACDLYPAFAQVLLGVFIIIWVNDAGAYFVGKTIGKRKIFPSVSPGKSWEGWIGGIVIGVLGAVIISHYFHSLNVSEWINLGIYLGITGLIGDLIESSWKRSHNLKDSSNLFPGHGGFLDRLDSFIYSVPFATLFYLVLQYL